MRKASLFLRFLADFVVDPTGPVPTPSPHFPILPEDSLRDLEQSPKEPGVSLLKHLSLVALAASFAALKEQLDSTGVKALKQSQVGLAAVKQS